MIVALTDNEKRVLLKRYEQTMSRQDAEEKLQILSQQIRQNHVREDNRIYSRDFKQNFQELFSR